MQNGFQRQERFFLKTQFLFLSNGEKRVKIVALHLNFYFSHFDFVVYVKVDMFTDTHFQMLGHCIVTACMYHKLTTSCFPVYNKKPLH